MSEVTLRIATLDDAAGIAEVHVRSWHSAYRGMLPDDLLAERTYEVRLAMWQERLASQEPRQRTYLAEVEGVSAGFCLAGSSRDEDAGERCGEIYSLYLDELFTRRGIGSKLIELSQEYLAQVGFTHATLWVLEANQRARCFYEKKGWAADGVTRSVPFFDASIPEVRYAIDLTLKTEKKN
jgi:ribosomal protein S18 acetylase RimI-like enzyme